MWLGRGANPKLDRPSAPVSARTIARCVRTLTCEEQKRPQTEYKSDAIGRRRALEREVCQPLERRPGQYTIEHECHGKDERRRRNPKGASGRGSSRSRQHSNALVHMHPPRSGGASGSVVKRRRLLGRRRTRPPLLASSRAWDGDRNRHHRWVIPPGSTPQQHAFVVLVVAFTACHELRIDSVGARQSKSKQCAEHQHDKKDRRADHERGAVARPKRGGPSAFGPCGWWYDFVSPREVAPRS